MITIEIHQDAGVKNIRELHTTIGNAVKTNEEIILDFSRLKRLDLSLAQVLIAAGVEARLEKKILKLRSLSDDIRRQLALCGIVK